MPKSLAALVILAWPVLSHAQSASPPTTLAADAAARVAPLNYRSAFDATPRGVELGTETWKAANAAVGQFPRGHRDVYKWEKAQQQDQKAPVPAPAAAPAPLQ